MRQTVRYRILLILLGLGLLSAAAFAQHGWSCVYQNGETFDFAVFPTPSVGWASTSWLDEHYALWKTNDGGETWTGIIPRSVIYGHTLAFYNDQRAFMSLGGGAVMTEDGFNHWEMVYFGGDTAVEQSVYVDSTTLIGTCVSFDVDECVNQINISLNSGRTWERVFYEICTSPSLHGLGPICVSPSGTVIVGYSPNSLKRSINLGSTWEQINNMSFSISSACSPSPAVFYATGSSSILIFEDGYPVIAKSITDGRSWHIIWADSTLRHYELYQIAFPDPLHGWAVGDSGLCVQTTDGGITWERYFIENTSGSFYNLSFVYSTLGWAVDSYSNQTRIYRFGTPQSTDLNPQLQIPSTIKISSIYPNPFNSVTSIVYSVPNPSLIKVTLWDIAGREVATLVEGQASSGQHAVQWNAGAYASGIYFCQLQAGSSYSDTRKLLLIK